MIVFVTQYLENYGTATDPDWRAKGGLEYVIRCPGCLTEYKANLIAKTVIPQLQYTGSVSSERVTYWYTTDNKMTDTELEQVELFGEVLDAAVELPHDEVSQWLDAVQPHSISD